MSERKILPKLCDFWFSIITPFGCVRTSDEKIFLLPVSFYSKLKEDGPVTQ